MEGSERRVQGTEGADRPGVDRLQHGEHRTGHDLNRNLWSAVESTTSLTDDVLMKVELKKERVSALKLCCLKGVIT